MFDGDRSPFADPHGTVNPFTDESVQSVANTSSPRLDDYNPFVKDRSCVPIPQPVADAPSVAVTTQPASTSASQTAVPVELINQQRQLERTAANLERESQSRYQHDNFPPLPSCCPMKPCFRQDFDVDIPAPYRRIVKSVYFFWLAYAFMLFLNVVACLTTFIAASKMNPVRNSWTAISFGISIGYLVCFCPLSFICWYRPLYNAFRNDSSANFFCFFFVFLLQLGVMIFACLGIGYFCSGWSGYFIGFQFLGYKKYGIGAFLVICGVLFTIMAVFNFVLLSLVVKYYRTTGATFQKAQDEVSQKVKSATSANVSVGNISFRADA